MGNTKADGPRPVSYLIAAMLLTAVTASYAVGARQARPSPFANTPVVMADNFCGGSTRPCSYRE